MKVVKIEWIFLTLLLTGGCGNYNYIPNMHNIPLLKEQGEIHLDFSVSGGDALGLESQAAFSAAKHFGIIGSCSKYSCLMVGDEYDKCHGYFIEGGAGTFVPINRHFLFETYTGFGFGKMINGYPYSRNAILRFERYFLQPSVGYASEFFEAAIAIRISGLRYHDNQYVGSTPDGDPFQLVYIEKNPFSILIEPAVILRVGWESAKFQLKAGYSDNITLPDLWQPDFYYSVGIFLTLSNQSFTELKPAFGK